MGDKYGLPRRGALHRTLVDLLLGERTDFVIRRASTSPSVVMRVGTEVAALCRTPSSLSSTLQEIVQVMDRGNPNEGCGDLAAVADVGAGQSAIWLGYRVTGGEMLRVEIADPAWAALSAAVGGLRDYKTEDTANAVKRLLLEWFAWVAPTFEHVHIDACCDRIFSVLKLEQFQPPSMQWLISSWRSLFVDWRAIRDGARNH